MCYNVSTYFIDIGSIINKRPMGHIAHMRNQFESINTFEKSSDYIITLIRRGKNPIREVEICNVYGYGY